MLTKEQGIQAIIDLQKMAGADEPRDLAEEAWEMFSVVKCKNGERRLLPFFG